MGKIRARADNEKLFFDFTYLDKRCREQTTLPDTPANRKKLEKILERIEAEITLGSFDYATYFPQSSKVQEFARLQAGCAILKTPPFRDFAERWFDEKRVEWRDTHIRRRYVRPLINTCYQHSADKKSAPSPRQKSCPSARHSAKFPG